MTTNKSLISKMIGTTQKQESNDNKMGDTTTKQGKKKKLCNNCKNWVYHNSDKCYTLEKNKQTLHHGTVPISIQKGQEKWEMKNDEERGPSNTEGTVIAIAP